MRLKAVVLNRAGIDPEMTRGGRAGVEGLECCPQGLVLFFPDAQEILGVWKNLLMFIEAAVGGIGHRIEAGPKVEIQEKKKKTDEGRTRGCGCGDRTGLHRKPEGLTDQVQR